MESNFCALSQIRPHSGLITVSHDTSFAYYVCSYRAFFGAEKYNELVLQFHAAVLSDIAFAAMGTVSESRFQEKIGSASPNVFLPCHDDVWQCY